MFYIAVIWRWTNSMTPVSLDLWWNNGKVQQNNNNNNKTGTILSPCFVTLNFAVTLIVTVLTAVAVGPVAPVLGVAK
jgi:hypothetical protein